MSGQRVVITGATGFIGAHLAATTARQGAEVYAFFRKSSDTLRLTSLNVRAHEIPVDLLDSESVKQHLSEIKPNYVFNTAVGRAFDDWSTTLKLNSSAMLNLLHASSSPFLQKFVHFGSSTEYGEIEAPFCESDPIKPNSLFGASKAACTLQFQQLAQKYSVPVVVLRLFQVYGELDQEHRLIPTIIKNIISNQPVKITKPGLCRDYVYIEDVIAAALLAASKTDSSGQIINIGSGVPIANEQVVSCIEEQLGVKADITKERYTPREWDTPDWYADITKAGTVLGWQPRVPLETGVQACITWIEKNA